MAGMIPRPDSAFALDPSGKETRRREDPKHLAFLRTLPSVVSGAYGVEACHLRAASPKHRKQSTGKGRKPDDRFCLPLTPAEHRQQHSMNELEFWRIHGIDDPFAIALALYAVTGNEAEALKVIMFAGARG
ncbi:MULTISPECIES: hypothetical protein [Aurantimonas]|uniref:hypothetical protein n=1 Tax=Aurantimonas TaxID=182269 RepID=UPI0035159E2E